MPAPPLTRYVNFGKLWTYCKHPFPCLKMRAIALTSWQDCDVVEIKQPGSSTQYYAQHKTDSHFLLVARGCSAPSSVGLCPQGHEERQGTSKMSGDEAGVVRVMRFGWAQGSLVVWGSGRVTQPPLAPGGVGWKRGQGKCLQNAGRSLACWMPSVHKTSWSQRRRGLSGGHLSFISLAPRATLCQGGCISFLI